MARYALSGVETHVVCFTCGEAGSIGISKDLSSEELCRRRTEEFSAACAALGVTSHTILGVPDKQVQSADREWVVAQILEAFGRIRPDVVITFHHRGVSGHPDHIAVSDFLHEAYQRAGAGGPIKLYEWGIPKRVSQLYQRKNLRPLKEDEIGAVIEVSDQAMDMKIEAIRRHETQYDFYLSMQEKFDYRNVARPEHFQLRAQRLALDIAPDSGLAPDIAPDSGPAQPTGMEGDLFHDVD